MNVNCITPFLESVKYTLEQFGVGDIRRGDIRKKSSFYVGSGVHSIIGFVGGIKGNVAYSMSEATAKNIISTMMMGMPVESIDDMGKSAIGELSNMITGHATIALADNGYNVNITTPLIMINETDDNVVSSVETIVIDLNTPVGNIEVNIGIEKK